MTCCLPAPQSFYLCCGTPIHPPHSDTTPVQLLHCEAELLIFSKRDDNMAPPHKPQPLFDVLVFMGEESLMGWAFFFLHHRHRRLPLWPCWHLNFRIRWPKVELDRQEWGVRAVYENVAVPANHLQSQRKGRWNEGKAKGQHCNTELHVTPLRMGNMELANV